MRFTIEERHLTDGAGRPLTDQNTVAFHLFEAESIDEVVRLYVQKDNAEVIGDVLKFPGFQAVATIRKASGVYTLQVTLASGAFQV